MARVLVTGSADGLGQLAAKQLIAQGHRVVLHARSERRAADAHRAVPQADAALHGELSSLASTRALAEQANRSGPFDAIIHNAGIYQRERKPPDTADGLNPTFQVNVLAPYLLTAVIAPPKRLVFMSSGMHRSGDASLDDPQWKSTRWDGTQAYCNSKLFDVQLAFAVARRWPTVPSNAVNPGWVATKMGGQGAPDDFDEGAATQVWLAVSDADGAQVTGRYFRLRQPQPTHPAATDVEAQDALLAYCASLCGVTLPG